MATACAPDEGKPPPEAPAPVAKPFAETAKETIAGACKDAWNALLSPLEDLNIKRQPIPEKLQGCAANPYAIPPEPLCPHIQKELAELDTLLGPDMEAKPLPWDKTQSAKKNYLKEGAAQAPSLMRQQAAGMVQSKTNIIPFRGVVRKVTGAEKHAQAVAEAYEAGRLRRAFLKGLAKANDCTMLALPPAKQ